VDDPGICPEYWTSATDGRGSLCRRSRKKKSIELQERMQAHTTPHTVELKEKKIFLKKGTTSGRIAADAFNNEAQCLMEKHRLACDEPHRGWWAGGAK